ncbi:glycoside hydrolase family 10 protein [Streptomyces sp. H27-D2]|uniref:glycoside hydrolase family 10 protein n=1 Tax=Streptomyces sp. H27-D2 TaxID=3046304 RepID=UPI002DBA5B2E|nr:family 10 glycosylhydrolase [Streptomyces sp. H27-D2]MEC4020438.1 family 10 glycosylhydrolase [Streptomyces sp. H27-D2]
MGYITRRGFTIAAAGALSALPAAGSSASAASASAARGRTRQFRGMWLATVANRDWPSAPGLPAADQRAELLAFLDAALARRLNAVVFQVRPTADALWPSPYEPWSEYLTGTQGMDPGWDPLGFAVREAHRRGLELHAWFNPYRIANHTDPSRLISTHPARLHPEWVVPYGGKLYYNPGLPEVRRFVQDAMLDAVARYDIDAVHWDDYFYPYPVAGQVFDDDEAYARHGAGFPDRAAWRRENIDLLVRETADRIRERGAAGSARGSGAAKRPVRFGVSPFAVWRNRATDPAGSDTRAGVQTYDNLHADTRKWVKEGWIDYIVPQVYWNIGFAAADYAKLVPWWSEVVKGTGVHLYIGEALYKAGDPAQPAAWQDPAELSRHLAFDRRYPQVRGNVYFSAKEVVEDRIGAMARVVADHYPRPVRPPG